VKIERAKTGDHAALVGVWERAVRATHDFLTEEDIVSLRDLVRDQALPALQLWVIRGEGGEPLGFMGMHENSVEALFVDPAFHGRGAGRAFLDLARRLHGSLKVDVNEQNPRAAGFYANYGFVQTGRSPLDSGGRPFPILHFELPAVADEEGSA